MLSGAQVGRKRYSYASKLTHYQVSTPIDGFMPSHIPLIGLIDNC